MNISTRQVRRQRLAFGLAFRLRWRCRELRQFFFHRRQVGIDGFLEQLPLLDRPVLGLDAEAPALEQRQFMGQFVDLGLAPVQLAVFLDQQATQFVSAELVEVGW